MDVSELLASTSHYLRQLVEGTAQDEDPIEVSESLLQDIETASADVKKELQCKFLGSVALFQGYSHSTLLFSY